MGAAYVGVDPATRYSRRMARLRPGWFVVLCSAVLLVSAWLPWLVTSADGGGRANAIGGQYRQHRRAAERVRRRSAHRGAVARR